MNSLYYPPIIKISTRTYAYTKQKHTHTSMAYVLSTTIVIVITVHDLHHFVKTKRTDKTHVLGPLTVGREHGKSLPQTIEQLSGKRINNKKKKN